MTSYTPSPLASAIVLHGLALYSSGFHETVHGIATGEDMASPANLQAWVAQEAWIFYRSWPGSIHIELDILTEIEATITLALAACTFLEVLAQ